MKTIAKAIFFPLYLLYRVIDKVSYAMMQVGPYADYGNRPATFPPCVICAGLTFIPASKPTFTANRFGQQQITVFVDCLRCGLRLRAIRSDGTNWSFTESS